MCSAFYEFSFYFIESNNKQIMLKFTHPRIMTSLSGRVILFFFSARRSCFTHHSSDSLSVALKHSLWNTQSIAKEKNEKSATQISAISSAQKG